MRTSWFENTPVSKMTRTKSRAGRYGREIDERKLSTRAINRNAIPDM